MASKYYKLSQRTTRDKETKEIKKVSNYIIIDDSVTPTPKDIEDIKLYIQCGFTIQHKSAKRAAAAKERAKKNGFGKNNKKKTEETKTTAE